MTKSNRHALETFGSELMDMLLHGSRRRVVIGFPTATAAEHFRNRIHRMRTAMRKAEHTDYPIAARARLTVWKQGMKLDLRGSWSDRHTEAQNKADLENWEHDKIAFVEISPHDSEFGLILSTLDGGDSRGTNPATPDTGDGFLSDLTKDKRP